MSVGIVTVLLLTLLVAGIPATAEASGAEVTIRSGVDRIPQGHIHHYPTIQGHIHHFQRRSDVIHHRAPVIVVPQPVYVGAPRRCVVPGYWAYAWVSQNYVSNVWVPGYYNTDALWVEGHYESRVHPWGYYQPHWVPEYWTHC